MARMVGKIGLALLVAFIILTSVTFIGGRVMRANAPEMVFMRGDRDVYALDVERSFVRLLAHTDFDMNVPSWSPDGRYLTFTVIDGSGEKQVAQTTMPRSSDWSPDGRLAFISNLQLYIASADGDIQPIMTDLYVDRSPLWSPDGEDLAFVSGGDLYLIDPNSGEAHLLTPDNDSRAITAFAWRW